MIYLASPYNHEDPSVRDWRYEQTMELLAGLLMSGKFVYSPIVHCHEMSKKFPLSIRFDFWREFDFHMIDLAKCLYVYQLEGWETSTGVSLEIAHAENISKPVVYLR